MAVTLAALHRSLPEDLRPFPGDRAVPATPISAVHVSELADPTRYLEGGELLLTTGLSAQLTVAWFHDYLTRLREAGVAGVALGLGPRFEQVPAAFAQAARASTLPLFVVPAPTPFLTITRRYWDLRAVTGRRRVADTLAGHRALVEAASEPDAERAVVRRLAACVDGWAALLSPGGALRAVHPASGGAHARQLRDEVARLAVAGAHAAATLPVDGHVVVLHPLADGAAGAATLAGYMAVGSSRPLEPEQHHLVLAGVAVLGARLNHRRELAIARAAARTPVLQLLLAGSPEASRALAALVAPGLLTQPHRPAVAAGPPGVLAGLARSAMADERCAVAWADGSTVRLLLAGDTTADWLAGLVRGHHGSAGAVGPAVVFDGLADALGLLAARAGTVAPGTVAELGTAEDSLLAHLEPALVTTWARHRLAPVLDYDRAALVPALAAYLRHSGGWEAAARELGVHRHTLRYRIRRAEELLGVDLASADATAELWLALRATGRA